MESLSFYSNLQTTATDTLSNSNTSYFVLPQRRAGFWKGLFFFYHWMGDTEGPAGSFHLIDSLRLWLFPPFLGSMECHATGVPYGFTSGYLKGSSDPCWKRGGQTLANERQEMRESWRIHCPLCPLIRWSEVGSCCTDSTEMPCVADDQLPLSYAPLCLCFLVLLAALPPPTFFFPWDCALIFLRRHIFLN